MQMDQQFEKIDQYLQELHQLLLTSQKDSPVQSSTSIAFHASLDEAGFSTVHW